MRLRKKWWARPELEDSDIVITSPDAYKGKWNDEFKNNNKIYLELGCGMGSFISQSATLNPNINYIGIDLKDEVLVNAKRNIENSTLAANTTINNVRLIPFEISFINNVFEKDEIDRIYINFCNPWPKLRHNKRRLTHTTFLSRYKQFLKPNSQIWFKTDNKGLFEDSKPYFEESGFKIKYLTYDLHNSDFNQNIVTEYEKKFSSMGMNIMFIVAELG